MSANSTDQNKHAVLSPSGADRWMVCPGSVKATRGLPDEDNVYSREGTDLHEVAALCLETNVKADDLVGQEMLSGDVLTKEQAVDVQKYVDVVLAYRDSCSGSLSVEERVPLVTLTGEKDAYGTSDAVVVAEDELIVIDAKFGRGVVVEPENNRQAMIYVLGVIEKTDLWEFVKTIRIVISQPRLGGPKEWTTTIEQMKAFRDEVQAAALKVETHPDLLVPSEKGCRFCKAKATCPALRTQVEGAMLEGFNAESMDEVIAQEAGQTTIDNVKLGQTMAKIPTIEAWIKSIRAEVERRLLQGESIPGWKLVQGKKGNRQWDDEKKVEDVLKSFKLKVDEMYHKYIISPTDAEKLLKKEKPAKWEKLQEHITQKEGAKSVAPADDPRPAIVIGQALDGFEVDSSVETFDDLL